MNPIAMVDLKGQYEKIKPQIDSAIQQVIDSTQFIKGPDVAKFQDEMATYLGVKHVIACGNGTDALQIAMMALGLKPGDEVITTSFTFIATVEVIALLGLKPVLVDVYPDTFNIDVNAVEKAITAKTRAIVPVHLFGQSADMESLMNLSKKHNIYIIEDTAQANGTNHYFKGGSVKKAGTIGHIGCTSFFPSKNLGCYGDGGALFTNDDNLAEQIHSIINHGMKVRYYHDRIGVNSRLDTIQAAILRVKLAHLDEYNKARNAAAQFYTNELSALQGIELPKQQHSPIIFIINTL
jgi:dTDP-4-amino-4,6-dideoxygalactose transaminase